MTTPTLFIDGENYVESKQGTTAERSNCIGCIFGQHLGHCNMALSESPAIFGGDCMQRDVIYVKQSKVAA